MTRIKRLQPLHLIPALVLPTLLLAAAADTQATDCDCSCEAFDEMRSAMEELQASANAGGSATPPAELQRIAGCAGQCAMAWGQCNNPDAPSEPDERPISSGQEDRKRTEREAAAEPIAEAYALGEPRTDLERFYGVYGSTDNPNRDFFVTQASNPRGEGRAIPPGYLMIGAMWGDVAPWYMKSVGELRFEQQWTNPGANPLVVEFKTDAQGQAVSMRFLSGFLADRGEVKRNGDLPEGW